MMIPFLKYAYRGNQEMTADEADRLLNPSAWELADLLFNTKTGEFWAGLCYLLKGFAALFLGLVDAVKRATSDPDPLRFSHYQVPEYWQPEEDELPMFKTESLPKAPNEIISEKVIYENTGQSKPS